MDSHGPGRLGDIHAEVEHPENDIRDNRDDPRAAGRAGHQFQFTIAKYHCRRHGRKGPFGDRVAVVVDNRDMRRLAAFIRHGVDRLNLSRGPRMIERDFRAQSRRASPLSCLCCGRKPPTLGKAVDRRGTTSVKVFSIIKGPPYPMWVRAASAIYITTADAAVRLREQPVLEPPVCHRADSPRQPDGSG
jgi:hypothetical protein